MSDITPLRNITQIQGARFLSAVSEALVQGIAADTAFQSYFQIQKFDFKLFGQYGGQALPFYFDGMDVFQFQGQIVDAWAWVKDPGSSGSTEFDVEIETTPGAGWVSIFTTKPKIAFNSAGGVSYVWVGVVNSALIGPAFTYPAYTPPTFTTQPVLDPAVVNSIAPFTAMRAKLTQTQNGLANDCGIMVRVRNINQP